MIDLSNAPSWIVGFAVLVLAATWLLTALALAIKTVGPEVRNLITFFDDRRKVPVTEKRRSPRADS